MAYRIEIERALDEMISEETGNKFQGIAVVHAKQKWPQLVACERNWDGGLDAYASGDLDEGKGVGLACSITATPRKSRRMPQTQKRTIQICACSYSQPQEK